MTDNSESYGADALDADAGGVTKQMINDAANSPLAGMGQLVSTPQPPNPYHALWEQAKIGSFNEPYQAKAPMSQHGAISHEELTQESLVSGDEAEPTPRAYYSPLTVSGPNNYSVVPVQQRSVWPDFAWGIPVVSCPKCGGPCQHITLSLREEDSDVVFRCIPCYERHHAARQSSTPNVPVSGSPDVCIRSSSRTVPDMAASCQTGRSQSRAWDAAPWVDEPLSHAGTYCPTD